MRTRSATLGILLALTSPTLARADSNLLLILDASNSMWGQIGGTAKIETAKTVLTETLTGLADDVLPALMIYGHRSKDDCNDVQLVAPFGAISRGDMLAAVNGITPRGKTPIANALMAAIGAFDGRLEENNSILLISDGLETCEGDPCAVAGTLSQRGINVKVNVIGFDVDAKARAQLECVARAGGGEYFNAKDAGEFKVAVARVQEVVKAPEPEPEPAPLPVVAPAPEPAPPPAPVIYFEDLFDGAALNPAWQVVNPNDDNYLVEDGVLSMVAADGISASYGAADNVLRLDKPLPKGDWTITARILLSPKTMGERFRIGLARDKDNGLYATFEMSAYNYNLTRIYVSSEKLAKGESAHFERLIMEIEDGALPVRAAQFSDRVQAVQVRLEKAGRNYVASAYLETGGREIAGVETETWLTVQQLSSLKSPGDAFAIIFGSTSSGYTPDHGESLVKIDWVRVEETN